MLRMGEQRFELAPGDAAAIAGGTLVYAVCTLNPGEERLAAGDSWRTLPSEDGTDGFYAARATL